MTKKNFKLGFHKITGVIAFLLDGFFRFVSLHWLKLVTVAIATKFLKGVEKCKSLSIPFLFTKQLPQNGVKIQPIHINKTMAKVHFLFNDKDIKDANEYAKVKLSNFHDVLFYVSLGIICSGIVVIKGCH